MVLRLLIADDSSDDAALVVRALVRAGVEISWRRVETEPAFTAALPTTDLVICDHAMPQFSPDRALDLVGTVPLILMSGSITPERVAELLARGARCFVPKDRIHEMPAAVLAAI